MAQCMNALADKVHKQKKFMRTCRYALHNMATLFNNHQYIISSKLGANSQYALPPQSFPQESARGKRSQFRSPSPRSPENFLTMAADFRPFQVCHFKMISYYVLLLLLQTGAGSMNCSMYF